MAILPLSQLTGWKLADPGQDLRGRRLLDERGDVLGTVIEMAVNTETNFVQSVILADGRAFSARLLRLEGNALSVV
jgi:sporulation protein YlmC with PRC-barrel domain